MIHHTHSEWLRYYVPRFVCCTAYILALCSCSISNPIKANSLVLPKGPLDSQSSYYLEEIDQDPYLYKIIDHSGNAQTPPSFVTAVKQCGGVGRTTSTTATTRQLLVGLSDISIKRQAPLVVAQNKVLFSLLQARLDNKDLTVLSFSSRDDHCVTDLVAWNQTKYNDPLIKYLTSANEDQLSSWASKFSIFTEQ